MKFGRSAVETRCFRALCAAVLTAAFGFAAPAAAAPVFSNQGVVDVAAGAKTTVSADTWFEEAGTNPEFTDAVFTSTAYYSEAGIDEDGKLEVEVMTAAALNALTPPPATPFTIDAYVTMTNDEGETASGTIRFQTTYARSATASPPTPPAPTFAQTEKIIALPGSLIGVGSEAFDNPGTNPQITEAVFSTTDYYDTHEIRDGRLWVKPRSETALNALPSPPPSPFSVTVQVTLSNDEGQTATGTLIFETRYNRNPSVAPGAQPNPIFSQGFDIDVAPGGTATVRVTDIFDYAGQNPSFEGVTLGNLAYLDTSGQTFSMADPSSFSVTVKTAAQLRALPAPPRSPFNFTARVRMVNDAGLRGEGTVRFRTTYTPYATAVSHQTAGAQSGPPASTPTLRLTGNIDAAPGEQVTLSVNEVFADAGTRPMFTSIGGNADHFASFGFHPDKQEEESEAIQVTAKTAGQLNAMTPPPASPFTPQINVEMTNDEGRTASGTLTFRTTYTRARVENGQAVTPTLKSSGNINAPPGEQVVLSVADVFADAGTNPKFTSITGGSNYVARYGFHPDVAADEAGSFSVTAKTAGALNAMTPPPDTPFTFQFDVEMTNDEGQTASGTVTFETTYARARVVDGEVVTPTAKTGPFTLLVQDSSRYGLQLLPGDLFDNAGTNPRWTGQPSFSTRDYYHSRIGLIALRIGGETIFRLNVRTKTTAQLNALSPPPPSRFEVDVTATMTNDEGQQATGTFTFQTSYDRDDDAPPVAKYVDPINVPDDGRGLRHAWLRPAELFENAGTNPYFTRAVYSDRRYYRFPLSDLWNKQLTIAAKTAAQLNAMTPPPPSPFTVHVTVTMTNDEGQTATGTFALQTTYPRAASSGQGG